MEIAKAVGTIHGRLVILHIDAKNAGAGFIFYRSENNVWLVDAIPAQYITL
jgi:putative RNA 2'-phosphotransferase